MDKRIYLSGILIVFFLIAISVTFFAARQRTNNEGMAKELPHITERPHYSLPFSVPTQSTQGFIQKGISQNQTKVIHINLNSKTTRKPNAFQIQATYDATQVEVIKLMKGDIWSDTNVLTSVVDPKTGLIKFAAGQGFGAHVAEGVILFSVQYRIKAGTKGNINLVIYPNSKFAYLNTQGTVAINPTSLVLVSGE